MLSLQRIRNYALLPIRAAIFIFTIFRYAISPRRVDNRVTTIWRKWVDDVSHVEHDLCRGRPCLLSSNSKHGALTKSEINPLEGSTPWIAEEPSSAHPLSSSFFLFPLFVSRSFDTDARTWTNVPRQSAGYIRTRAKVFLFQWTRKTDDSSAVDQRIGSLRTN